MKTVLAIDVGAGTQDILLWEEGTAIENCIKLVLPTRAAVLARQVEEHTMEGRPLFLEGTVMGSYFLSSAVKKHIKAGYEVYASPSAAKTFRDNLEEVKERGIMIAESPPRGMHSLALSDIELEPLFALFRHYGKPQPCRYLVAVQDHGECLRGSNRQVRFAYWREFLAGGGTLRSLLFNDIPPLFTRMKAIRERLPASELMDTGPAALLGALFDPLVKEKAAGGALVVNMGNQHVLAALMKGEKVLGLLEHHTCFMTKEKIAGMLGRFAESRLSHEEVWEEKGHGCVILDEYRSMEPFSFTAVTGPNRAMVRSLGYYEAAPFGDMMLTGCFGLLGAAGLLDAS
ncbi:MAG: DUF1786 domain-containing protein [Candidatus Eremiobacteraeota bacterium]|nr:DUF1786 domain-containing protein [Candidatus Eremiobacteraeota bacterium]